jgi:hypothetical protein
MDAAIARQQLRLHSKDTSQVGSHESEIIAKIEPLLTETAIGMLLVIWYDCRNESDNCDADFIYEEDQTLKYFACEKEMITDEVLTSWYTGRVHQIENRSCMVDHAVTLIKLARERNVMVSSEVSLSPPPPPMCDHWMKILNSFLSSCDFSFLLSFFCS